MKTQKSLKSYPNETMSKDLKRQVFLLLVIAIIVIVILGIFLKIKAVNEQKEFCDAMNSHKDTLVNDSEFLTSDNWDRFLKECKNTRFDIQQ